MSRQVKYLLYRIAQGNHPAFEELYKLYYDRLFVFAMFYLRLPSLAEDVVSETFLNLWKRKEAANNIECFDTYVYVAIKNNCLNLLKSGYHKQISLLHEEVHLETYVEFENPETHASYNQLNDALTAAIEKLPDRCRLIFKMAKEDNLDYKTIAEILNISPRTVETQVLIARKKLEEEIAIFLR